MATFFQRIVGSIVDAPTLIVFTTFRMFVTGKTAIGMPASRVQRITPRSLVGTHVQAFRFGSPCIDV
jgi:hypothetical protein